MSDVEQFLAAIFGSVIVLAIVSVIVGKKSQAPAVINDFGSALSKVVAAAVNPVSANYGYGNGNSSFSSPSLVGNQPLNLPGVTQNTLEGTPMTNPLLYGSPL
jgi:hypothetical protein